MLPGNHIPNIHPMLLDLNSYLETRSFTYSHSKHEEVDTGVNPMNFVFNHSNKLRVQMQPKNLNESQSAFAAFPTAEAKRSYYNAMIVIFFSPDCELRPFGRYSGFDREISKRLGEPFLKFLLPSYNNHVTGYCELRQPGKTLDFPVLQNHKA